MLSGLIEAFVAAAAYGCATIAQAVGVARMTAAPANVGLWRRLLVGWPYAAGLTLDALGLVASIAALQSLPLFLVESAVASSVGITAAAAVVILGVRLSRVEKHALATMLVGLVLLAVCAQPGPPQPTAASGRWWLLAAALALAVLAALGIRPRRAAAWPVITSGLGFAVVGIASRVLELRTPWWHTIADPALWALAVAGAVSMVTFGVALSRAPATTVAAVTFAIETIVPSVIGLVFLGDAVRDDLGPVAVIGFVATLAGCVSLARLADSEAALPQHSMAH